MDRLVYSHYFSLPSQGNIYTLTCLDLVNGTTKLLVASLKREIFCFEYTDGPNDELVPTVREVSFTYIPTGAEIISIDAYNKSTETNEFVVGITIIKNGNDLDAVETYLNIYSGWEASEDFNIENIAQNCQNVELNFTPYCLMNTDLIIWEDDEIKTKEKVFLLSGSDNLVHIFKEGPDHLFKEFDGKEDFPEFIQFPSVVVWIDVKYIHNESVRLVALGCECGYVKFYKVCVKTKTVIFNFSTRLDNHISQVRLYETKGAYNMIVISSIINPLIFMDVLEYGLSSYYEMGRHDECTTIFSCCEITDIDFDGQFEILIGSGAKELMLYKRDAKGEYDLEELRELSSPIFNIKHVDITGDGLKELIVFSMRGVHVFQHDPEFVQGILNEKMRKLTVKEVEEVRNMIKNE